MLSFLSWLVGSPTGRIVALCTLVAAGFGLALVWAFYGGRKAEQLEAITRSLETLRTRIASDEDLARLPADERRRRLREWADG